MSRRNKLFNKYLAMSKDRCWPEAYISKFCSHIRTKRSSLSDRDMHEIVVSVIKSKPVIVEEQAQKGLAWLWLLHRTPKKKLAKKDSPFSSENVSVLEHFHHFELVNFVTYSTTRGLIDAKPVYRVVSIAGEYFDYVPYPWQSRGSTRIEVVGSGSSRPPVTVRANGPRRVIVQGR